MTISLALWLGLTSWGAAQPRGTPTGLLGQSATVGRATTTSARFPQLPETSPPPRFEIQPAVPVSNPPLPSGTTLAAPQTQNFPPPYVDPNTPRPGGSFQKQPYNSLPDVQRTYFESDLGRLAPKSSSGSTGEGLPSYQIPLEPPGPGALFGKLDSEAGLQERIRQETKMYRPTERTPFPEEPIVSRELYAGRHWPGYKVCVEPNYVCYGKLIFEEKNSERYGWECGLLQPMVSTGIFFGQVATLPYRLATNPFRCKECSAGYCLPGDPVPYLLYPPGASVTGTVAEVGVGAALFVIFP